MAKLRDKGAKPRPRRHSRPMYLYPKRQGCGEVRYPTEWSLGGTCNVMYLSNDVGKDTPPQREVTQMFDCDFDNLGDGWMDSWREVRISPLFEGLDALVKMSFWGPGTGRDDDFYQVAGETQRECLEAQQHAVGGVAVITSLRQMTPRFSVCILREASEVRRRCEEVLSVNETALPQYLGQSFSSSFAVMRAIIFEISGRDHGSYVGPEKTQISRTLTHYCAEDKTKGDTARSTGVPNPPPFPSPVSFSLSKPTRDFFYAA
ncbi:uncharacterized protein BDZ83DRAFT_657973 [Colletotrichum acutatum]|uniref:Uncharacterized protein n=1 Tax=Glomerella acutata TaxID=27357 RepID=A0AAD8XAS5_GLOAC|nr:uncharacterized protein BDZ83DRAFT_657973 [Colletotrichum acutatum]KAK1706110.1 hypothetical protein BDZ83DRAFT_657973 [Colletotrichum acutatum]